jgi:(S)-mandelate dehydrogenase
MAQVRHPRAQVPAVPGAEAGGVSPARARNIDDLRTAARRRLPKVVFDYLEGGAEDHLSARANRECFESLGFAPRTLVDVSQRTLQTTLFGARFDAPFGISPVGAAGLFWHEAEIAMARAARAARIPFVLSTHSFVPLERVAWESGGPPWFQLYMPRERDAAAALLRRAHDAGSEVLVLTTDVPVGGNREYNDRNGFGVPLRLGARAIADVLAHPSWLAGVYFRSLWRRPLPHWGDRRDRAGWADLAWLRREWPRKLVVKGILGVEDARLALEHGVDGICISNHGGRQLDGAPAPLAVLPEIAADLVLDRGAARGAARDRRRGRRPHDDHHRRRRAPRRRRRQGAGARRRPGAGRPRRALRRRRGRRARRAPRAADPQVGGRPRLRPARLPLGRRARPAFPAGLAPLRNNLDEARPGPAAAAGIDSPA